MEDRTLLSTFVVSNTHDSGPGSLRQAILDSNASVGATSTIDFQIAGSGVHTISPMSPLPAIIRPVVIDGDSQPGFGGTPLIQLDGSDAGVGSGLLITGPGITVLGLDINSFAQGAGIDITGPSATGDWIEGDFIGTDPTGRKPEYETMGWRSTGGRSGNTIGGTSSPAADLISGNGGNGVVISGAGTDANLVEGDLIGTTVAGDSSLPDNTGVWRVLLRHGLPWSGSRHSGKCRGQYSGRLVQRGWRRYLG